MTNHKSRLAICLPFVLLSIFAHCQSKPSIQQKSDKSECSNIVALAGNVNINCSTLTPSQQKMLANIPALLNKILANRLDPDAVMAKLDEILKATSQPSQVFHCEDSNCGDTLINPQVNNFGPPPPPVPIVTGVVDKVDDSQPGVYKLRLLITIKNPFPNASFVVKCDRPCVQEGMPIPTNGSYIAGNAWEDISNPNWVVAKVDLPNPLIDGIQLTWWIGSKDGEPIHLISLQKGNIVAKQP